MVSLYAFRMLFQLNMPLCSLQTPFMVPDPTPTAPPLQQNGIGFGAQHELTHLQPKAPIRGTPLCVAVERDV